MKDINGCELSSSALIKLEIENTWDNDNTWDVDKTRGKAVKEFGIRMLDKKFLQGACAKRYGWTQKYMDTFKELRYVKIPGPKYFGWMIYRRDQNGHVLPDDITINKQMHSYLLTLEEKDERNNTLYSTGGSNDYQYKDITKEYMLQNGYLARHILMDDVIDDIVNGDKISSITGFSDSDSLKVSNALENNDWDIIRIMSKSNNREICFTLASTLVYRYCKKSNNDKNMGLINLEYLDLKSEWDARDELESMLNKDVVVLASSIDTKIGANAELIKCYIQSRASLSKKTILAFEVAVNVDSGYFSNGRTATIVIS